MRMCVVRYLKKLKSKPAFQDDSGQVFANKQKKKKKKNQLVIKADSSPRASKRSPRIKKKRAGGRGKKKRATGQDADNVELEADEQSQLEDEIDDED